MSPGLFARQLSLFRRLGYRGVSLAQAFGEQPPTKPVVVTFDDGYRDFFTNACPVLNELGWSATVFLVANQIGGTNAWDEAIGDITEPLLTESEIIGAPGVQFGSHTLDHIDLATADPVEARRQIGESKSKIEALIGEPIDSFCYPYGRKTVPIERMVQEAGYQFGLSVEGGMNDRQTNPMALRRINMRSDTTTPVLLFKILRDRRRG